MCSTVFLHLLNIMDWVWDGLFFCLVLFFWREGGSLSTLMLLCLPYIPLSSLPFYWKQRMDIQNTVLSQLVFEDLSFNSKLSILHLADNLSQQMSRHNLISLNRSAEAMLSWQQVYPQGMGWGCKRDYTSLLKLNRSGSGQCPVGQCLPPGNTLNSQTEKKQYINKQGCNLMCIGFNFQSTGNFVSIKQILDNSF